MNSFDSYLETQKASSIWIYIWSEKIYSEVFLLALSHEQTEFLHSGLRCHAGSSGWDPGRASLVTDAPWMCLDGFWEAWRFAVWNSEKPKSWSHLEMNGNQILIVSNGSSKCFFCMVSLIQYNCIWRIATGPGKIDGSKNKPRHLSKNVWRTPYIGNLRKEKNATRSGTWAYTYVLQHCLDCCHSQRSCWWNIRLKNSKYDVNMKWFYRSGSSCISHVR